MDHALQINDGELLRSILDNAHEAFVAIDGRGLVLDVNREAERTFGLTRAEMYGRELVEMVVPERLRTTHREVIGRAGARGLGHLLGQRIELTALHCDGHEFPVEVTLSATGPAGGGDRPPILHAFLHDISERKVTEHALVAMRAVTRAMAHNAAPGPAIDALLETLCATLGWQLGAYWQLQHDGSLDRVATWRVDAAGDAVEAFQALPAVPAEASLPGVALERGEPVWLEEFSSQRSFPRAEAAARAGLHTAVAAPVRHKAKAVGALELVSTERRAHDRSVSGALATIGVEVGELLGVLEERQALLTSLARLALTDELTALPNRRAWEEGLARELARARRSNYPVCVAVMDLDYFKRFNDEHGHQAGDALLAEAARAWHAQLRASDLLARYGGEEFAAVIPAWPLETVVGVVERLRRATPPALTASAGVAAWDGLESAEELFGRADAALYEAKQSGRNRTVAAPTPQGTATP